ncbi:MULTISPECIES: hypothetical protein [unclassified Streptomyces]|uniref:hypothetical protein n=1 Tax=unclassified Streptomyces TaxID=2593676 RepID=UPI003321AAF9
MELRSVEELMDLLHACRGTRHPADGGGGPVDVHDHALQTAALLRRGRPADKELQVAGLVHGIGRLLRPGDVTAHAAPLPDLVGPLLGDRVSRLGRLLAGGVPEPWDADDVLSLRQACEAGRVAGLHAGVLEDWRTVVELVAAHNSRLGAVD